MYTVPCNRAVIISPGEKEKVPMDAMSLKNTLVLGVRFVLEAAGRQTRRETHRVSRRRGGGVKFVNNVTDVVLARFSVF